MFDKSIKIIEYILFYVISIFVELISVIELKLIYIIIVMIRRSFNLRYLFGGSKDHSHTGAG
jgi:hypothetical protein